MPYGETTFTWTIINGICRASDEMTIRIDKLIPAEAGENTQECDITSFTLAGNEPSQGIGTWTTAQTGVTFDNENLPTATANNLPLGETTLMWTIVNGVCISQNTVIVEINNQPVTNLGADTQICEGETYTFHAGTGYDNYLWQDNLTSDSIFIADTSGIYNVTITNICGTVFDEAELTVNPLPQISARADTTICNTDTVALNAVGEGNITWSNGVSQQENFTPESTQTYIVTATLPTSCQAIDEVTIVVNPLPEITYVDTTVNGVMNLQTFSDAEPLQFTLNAKDKPNGTFTNLETGEYIITITDDNGCMIKTVIDLFVEIPLVIPSIFTPNGDGINDTWEIEGLFQFPHGRVYIMDRFGKTIAEYNGEDRGWDGTYNGNPVEPDTYWYVIEVRERHYKGSITIRR